MSGLQGFGLPAADGSVIPSAREHYHAATTQKLDTARRRVSFGSTAQVVAETAAASAAAAQAAMSAAASAAFDAEAGASVGVAPEQLAAILCQLDIVTRGEIPTFMQQQRVINMDRLEPVTKAEFAVLVLGLSEWREFVPRPVDDSSISEALQAKLTTFFARMDSDGDGCITEAEAVAFWGNNFAKLNATAMFNEVASAEGMITSREWDAFWQNVLRHGYTSGEIEEEVDMLLEGSSWVDFNDGRTTARATD